MSSLSRKMSLSAPLLLHPRKREERALERREEHRFEVIIELLNMSGSNVKSSEYPLCHQPNGSI